MTADALSDLLLVGACVVAFMRAWPSRAAFIAACVLMGCAASFGVLRYGGAAWALAPHRISSMLAGCAGLPLLAAAVAAPRSVVATRVPAVCLFAVVLGGLSVGAGVLGLEIARKALPAIGAVVVVYASLRGRRPTELLGAASLAAAIGVAAAVRPDASVLGALNGRQAMHALFAIAFLAFGYAVPSSANDATAE